MSDKILHFGILAGSVEDRVQEAQSSDSDGGCAVMSSVHCVFGYGG